MSLDEKARSLVDAESPYEADDSVPLYIYNQGFPGLVYSTIISDDCPNIMSEIHRFFRVIYRFGRGARFKMKVNISHQI